MKRTTEERLQHKIDTMKKYKQFLQKQDARKIPSAEAMAIIIGILISIKNRQTYTLYYCKTCRIIHRKIQCPLCKSENLETPEHSALYIKEGIK